MFRVGVVSALATAVTADSVLDGALAWIKANGEEVLDTTQHCVAAAKIASGLHSKCGQVFNPEGWAAFAAWGLLESLEYVDYPLASQLKNSSFIESAKEQTIKAGRGWSTMALKNHSESAWIHHLGQSENGVYSQNDHLMGHMMASRNGFWDTPKKSDEHHSDFSGS